ncbi:MAG: S41 family peptidase [Elusimicrobia bacterium]|nr:S41 family peptidase [Elusimicrobiota bacterium]
MRSILRSVVCAAALAVPAFGGTAPAVPAPGDDKTYEQLSFLVDVLEIVRENYVDSPDVQKLTYGAAAGLARTLDPFSQFMEPQDHREIKAETEGEFGGIGIRMVMKDDWLTVLTPLPGTPAYRAGLLPDDRIVEIDGESAKDLQVADAMEKLRGAVGSQVKLTVLRWPDKKAEARAGVKTSTGTAPVRSPEAAADGVEKEFTLTRESIKIESVLHRGLGDQIGYVRINEFSAHTSRDFRDALQVLSRDGLAGLVLDLRFNPGGLLSAAVDVAASFLGGDKLIVYTQGRRPDSRQEFRGGHRALYEDLPLVVLVNEASASGSEIIAGALQDHRRAVLMGERTYGKASVQSVIPLPKNCALRLTIARYYTPKGRSIHRDEKKKTGGIAPDIAAPVPHDVQEKIFAQWETIYEPGQKPRSAVGKDETVRDELLERAAVLLKSGEAVSRLKDRAR